MGMIAALLPVIIPLLMDVGKRFTGEKGDRIINLAGGALKGGAQELAAVQEIKAMVDAGHNPTDAELFGIIDRIDGNTDLLNQAVDKVVSEGKED